MGMLDRLVGRTEERKLEGMLRARCRDVGVDLPRSVKVVVDGRRARLEGSVTPSSAPAWLGRAPHPLLVEHAVSTARHLSLLKARRRLAEAVRGDAGVLVLPWTRLVHPLALRIVLEDLVDRDRGPYDWMSGKSGRIRDFHYQHRESGTIEFTRIMTDRRNEPGRVEHLYTFLPKDDGVQRAQITLTTVIPHSTAGTLAGRPMSDLVKFEDTGDEDVDRAIAALTIESAVPLGNSTVVTLAPTRWMTYARPPEKHRGWDAMADFIA